MEVSKGIYFLHVSFLKEVSETWLTKREIGNPANLFISLVSNKLCLTSCNKTLKELMSCDRTLKEISKTKYTLKSVPGYFDLITERSLPNREDITDNDLYSLKVASFFKIVTLPAFFVVSDSEKSKITELAKKNNFSMEILSPNDFC